MIEMKVDVIIHKSLLFYPLVWLLKLFVPILIRLVGVKKTYEFVEKLLMPQIRVEVLGR